MRMATPDDAEDSVAEDIVAEKNQAADKPVEK
jgi:hypothetical protein